MDFPQGITWPTWQQDYRYGALVIEPPRPLSSVLDPIRLRLDPESAAAFGARITLTPPFAAAPNSADEARVASVIRGVASMRLQLDRPTQFSGSSVVYLPVVGLQAFSQATHRAPDLPARLSRQPPRSRRRVAEGGKTHS